MTLRSLEFVCRRSQGVGHAVRPVPAGKTPLPSAHFVARRKKTNGRAFCFHDNVATFHYVEAISLKHSYRCRANGSNVLAVYFHICFLQILLPVSPRPCRINISSGSENGSARSVVFLILNVVLVVANATSSSFCDFVSQTILNF